MLIVVLFFIIAPALAVLFVNYRWSLEKALLWIYLPILLWVPLYLHMGFHGVYIDPGSLAGTALAVLAFNKYYRTWRFSYTDVLVLCYVLTAFWADAHHRPWTIGVYAMTACAWAAGFPYVIGKGLIEQTRSRESVAKLIVISLAILAVFSVIEFRLTYNFFQSMTVQVTHLRVGWARQRRWGFARIAGPYGHAITAGMVFTIGVMLQVWLLANKLWRTAEGSYFSKSQKNLKRNAKVITFLTLMGLFMTQSRGPWIGCLLGFIFAGVGLTKNRKRSAIIAGILFSISLATSYVVLDNYTTVDNVQDASTDQQDAIYRRELFTTYKPIIAEGGIWGWGSPVPDVTGFGAGAYTLHQPSIDNEYLRIAMAQGYAGAVLFILMIISTIIVLVKFCVLFRRRVDITFAFILLGIVVATSFSLSTVFLGLPMMPLFFMIFGWSQALRPTPQANEAPLEAIAKPQFDFEKVFS